MWKKKSYTFVYVLVHLLITLSNFNQLYYNSKDKLTVLEMAIFTPLTFFIHCELIVHYNIKSCVSMGTETH